MSNRTKSEDTDPSVQVSNIIASVTAVLHAAGEKAADGSRLITEKVVQQSETNAKKVFETLQSMSKSRNPADIATLYTDFVREAAQMHAQQLVEMGQIMARTNKEAWEPITNAIMTASKLPFPKP